MGVYVQAITATYAENQHCHLFLLDVSYRRYREAKQPDGFCLLACHAAVYVPWSTE